MDYCNFVHNFVINFALNWFVIRFGGLNSRFCQIFTPIFKSIAFHFYISFSWSCLQETRFFNGLTNFQCFAEAYFQFMVLNDCNCSLFNKNLAYIKMNYGLQLASISFKTYAINIPCSSTSLEFSKNMVAYKTSPNILFSFLLGDH